MKIYKNLQGKILLTSTLGLLLILPSAVFAVNTTTLSGVIEASQGNNTSTAAAATPAADKPTEVIVTEMVPGADCEPFGTGTGAAGKQYKCKVTGGFSSVMGIVSALIKYTTYITALIGVLMMVITGIAYMFGE